MLISFHPFKSIKSFTAIWIIASVRLIKNQEGNTLAFSVIDIQKMPRCWMCRCS